MIFFIHYKENRSREHPKKFLKNFEGYLHTDGYEAYHRLKDEIVIVGCWAHARRKFTDALKIIPKESRKGSNTEKGFKDLTPDERQKQRTIQSLRIVEELFSWAKSFEFKKMSKSLLKTAIGYLINQEVYLRNVFLDGRLELSNNIVKEVLNHLLSEEKTGFLQVLKKELLQVQFYTPS